MLLNSREKQFVEQAERFLEEGRRRFHLPEGKDLVSHLETPPSPLEPVLVENYQSFTADEKTRVLDQYREWGLGYYIALNPETPSQGLHPLYDVAEQFKQELSLFYPLTHPHDGHSEAVKRFGKADGTFKVYNLPKLKDGPKYREIAETNEPSEAHSDGLGTAGAVKVSVMYGDQAPMWGGYTFFYDMMKLGAILASQDFDAFQSLFLPDAMATMRPRGKGAIKVITPIFYINEEGVPQTSWRRPCGEYYSFPRENCSPLERAWRFLEKYTTAFCPGSFFVALDAGHGCMVDNWRLSHGRTGFLDSPKEEKIRCLSRKWFMSSQRHEAYKHVPGTNVHPDYAQLFPEYFGEDQMTGYWLYNKETDANALVEQ